MCKLYAVVPGLTSPTADALRSPTQFAQGKTLSASKDGSQYTLCFVDPVSSPLDFSEHGYHYKNGAITQIWTAYARLDITDFRKEAPPNVFSLEGMRELPYWLYRLLRRWI